MSINVPKWTLFLSLCASSITSFLLVIFSKSHPVWNCLELFPFLVHSSFCTRNLLHLGHRDEIVHQITMRQRSKSFTCNVIFMVFGLRRFRSLSRGFLRFHKQPNIVLEFFSDAISGFTTTFVMLQVIFCVARLVPFFQFLFAFLRISLYSLSSGSMK